MPVRTAEKVFKIRGQRSRP